MLYTLLSMTSPSTKAQLTEEKETLLATLYGRAIDSRAKNPILGDTTAADTVRRLDYDFTRMRLSPGDAAGVALRARQLDVWTARFLARHEEATVVHLGCGLDTRVQRLDPGPGCGGTTSTTRRSSRCGGSSTRSARATRPSRPR